MLVLLYGTVFSTGTENNEKKNRDNGKKKVSKEVKLTKWRERQRKMLINNPIVCNDTHQTRVTTHVSKADTNDGPKRKSKTIFGTRVLTKFVTVSYQELYVRYRRDTRSRRRTAGKCLTV